MAKAKKAKTSKVKRRKIASKPLKKVTTKLKKAVKKVSKKPVSKPVAAPAPAPLPGERATDLSARSLVMRAGHR